VDEMGLTCGIYVEEETFLQGFWRRNGRKETTWKRRLMWEDNNEKDLKEIGWEDK
jgi:hypothetical protein